MPTDSFTTAGSFSWVCPAGVTSVTVECVGGGGGGDGGELGTRGGGGGRGGDYASSVVTVTPGTSYAIVVGDGGSGASFGTSGGAGSGGPSPVASAVVVAAGGRGSANGATGATSPNGTSVGTTVNFGVSGGNAGSGAGSNGGAGGAGGTPRGGAGGAAGVTAARAGGNGTAPGGGGGGGYSNTGGTGGSGAAGAVYITYAGAPQTITPAFIASTSQVFAPTVEVLSPPIEPADTSATDYVAHPPIIKVATHSRPEVRVDGYWLSTFVPYWGDLKMSTRINGDWQCSFTIATDGANGHWRHPAIRFGAPVEVYFGPARRWVGTLTEPDWDSGEMVALGACRDAETALSITSTGTATTVPNTAIDAAIARGVVSWTRLDSFGTTAVGQTDDSGGLVTLQSVLDAWAAENNSQWRVDRQRRLVISPVTESVVDWFVVPGAGVLGSADDERVDRVFVRYLASTTGTLATASYPATSPVGGNEKPMDITDRGVMTATKATSIAQAEWEKLRGRSGWTNGLTLTRGQVTTPGGIPADLSMIRAGHAIRLLGVPDPRGLAQNIDVVIGDTDYDWSEDTIQINPVGMAARDTESVLEQVGNLAVDAMRAATGHGFGDMDWTSVTTTGSTGVAVAYKVRNGWVAVRFTGSGTLANATNAAVVAAGVLPTAVRPQVNIWQGGFIAGGLGGAGVNADGGCAIRQESGASRTGTHAAIVMYPAAA